MPRNRCSPEEVVARLHQVDVPTVQRQSMADANRQIGVNEVTFYRWRREFDGLKVHHVKRLKDFQFENSRLESPSPGTAGMQRHCASS